LIPRVNFDDFRRDALYVCSYILEEKLPEQGKAKKISFELAGFRTFQTHTDLQPTVKKSNENGSPQILH
jgi:hypothetical protein